MLSKAALLAVTLFAQNADYRHTPIDGKPTLALLPVVNVSGEKWEELKSRQVEKVNEHVVKEFTARGFAVVPGDAILEAVKRRELDLKDEEVWKRQTFFDLGKDVGAKYVLFIAITRTEQKQQNRALYTDLEGQAEIKMWLLNCESGEAIVSAKTFVGRSGGARVGDGKGSNRQIQAAANAVGLGLRDFLKSFPVVKN